MWNAPVRATGYNTFTVGIHVGTQNPDNKRKERTYSLSCAILHFYQPIRWLPEGAHAIRNLILEHHLKHPPDFIQLKIYGLVAGVSLIDHCQNPGINFPGFPVTGKT